MLNRITTKTIISLILINFLSIAFADEKDAIWITPSSTDYSRLATGLAGSNISIITSEEIITSKHKTIPELLSNYSGIQIRNLYSGVGSSSTTIDMRGFGESSGKNVMILLNGRRLNDIDMSGVNFSSIPHETIERIEIVRGGSAATIYGDGAVGGAINIVTKDTNNTKNHLSLNTASYGSHKGGFTAPLLINKKTGMLFSGSVSESDTYRDRSDYSNENLLVRVNHQDDNYKLNFDATDSKSKQLLPGPRSIGNLNGSAFATDVACNLLSDSRTAVRLAAHFTTPGECWDQEDDFAEFDIRSFSGGIDYKLSNDTKIIASISNRDKEQRALALSGASTLGNSTSGDNYNVYNLDTDYISLRLVHNDFIDENLGRFTFGIDLQETDYTKKNSQNQTADFGYFVNAAQESRSIYTQNSLNLLGGSTILSFGLRSDKADYKVNERYDTSVSKFSSKTARDSYQTSMSNTASNIGAEYILDKNMVVSAKYSRAFRTPDLDARNQVKSGDPDFFLKDQTSKEIEFGLKYQNMNLNFNSSVYEMDTENEIRYVPSFNNTNLDPIKRKGVDLDIVYEINNNLDVSSSFSYVDARFKSGSLAMAAFGGTYAADSTTAQQMSSARMNDDGTYNIAGLKVPLVSKYNYNVGLKYQFNSKFNANFDWSFVDDKFVSNDQENIEPVIPAYHLFDLRFSSDETKHHWSFGINNILNTSYYDFAISSGNHMDSSYGRQNVYPLMRRNLSLDYSYKF
jgi:iron complex outermembrane receptor protein